VSVPWFVKGEGVRVWLRFRDPLTRALKDPVGPVVVRVDPPVASPMPATRVLTAARLEEGVFFVDTAGDAVGRWMVRGASSGSASGVGADEAAFDVRASRMR
jgi:hypothetical protein